MKSPVPLLIVSSMFAINIGLGVWTGSAFSYAAAAFIFILTIDMIVNDQNRSTAHYEAGRD